MYNATSMLSINDWIRCWKFVDRKSNEECWPWLGSTNEVGYGRFRIKESMYLPHRIIFKIWYNIEPAPLLVCHECDNSSCCNPHHLFLGTYSDNQKDSYSKGRRSNKGSKNPRAILTEEKVEKIRQLLRKLSCMEIAKLFNVNEGAIKNIARNANWIHVK